MAASPGSSLPTAPEPLPPAIGAAEQQLAGGNAAACLALLAVLPADLRGSLAAHQLQTMCRLRLAGRAAASDAWWRVSLGLVHLHASAMPAQPYAGLLLHPGPAHACAPILPPPAPAAPLPQLFGLDASAAAAADVRRQYRRLAALVHPDKCRLPGAAEAFQRLQAAAEALLAALQDGSGAPRSKRARTAAGAPAGSGAAAAGLSDGEDDEEADDGWTPDGAGFPWWDEWDAPQAAVPAQQGQQGSCDPGCDAAQQQAAAGTSAPEEQQDDELHSMPLDALRAEVRRRQDALLEPQTDAAGRRIPMHQLQQQLRRARTVLADRVAAAATEQAAARGGGFLR